VHPYLALGGGNGRAPKDIRTASEAKRSARAETVIDRQKFSNTAGQELVGRARALRLRF